jgi:hypothetical protein
LYDAKEKQQDGMSGVMLIITSVSLLGLHSFKAIMLSHTVQKFTYKTSMPTCAGLALMVTYGSAKFKQFKRIRD